jgi:hypothetical protein
MNLPITHSKLQRSYCKYTHNIIRIRILKKDRQHNGQGKGTQGQTTIYKTLHIKLKIG